MKRFNFRHPMFPSVLAEFVFPILGYFFWEWNLFYIMMFYAADILSLTVIAAVKQKWIVFPPAKSIKTEQEKQKLTRGILLSVLVGILALAGFVVGLSYAFSIIQPNHLSWTELTIRFFKEEFLILLVLPLARWLEFTMFFKMKRRYLNISQVGFLKTFYKNQSLVVAFAGLAIGLALINVHEFVIILIGVSAKLGFDLWKLSRG